MVVPTMNTKQIKDEYQKGFRNLENKVDSFINKLRKRLRAKKQRHCFFTYTDPQKNKWGSQILVAKHGHLVLGFMHYEHPQHGKCALLMNREENTLFTFTGHFFRRYNERLQLGFQATIDSMEHFFLHNIEISVDDLAGVDFQSELPSGIGLGIRQPDDRFDFRTFISHNMLRGDQINISEELQKELMFGRMKITDYQAQVRLAS